MDILEQLAEKVVVECDGEDIDAALKGHKFTLWVNVPGIARDLFWQFSDDEPAERAYGRFRSIVALMYERDRALIDRLPDSIVKHLFDYAFNRYVEFEDNLRKNSHGG